MICEPSRSASLSASREYFKNTDSAPNWMPSCASCPAVPPPITAPSTANGICASIALLACCVECRSTTCEVSCASTPASSPSLSAAVIAPRLTNTGPPGKANALISLLATTWYENGHFTSPGACDASLCPSCCTYCVIGLESGSTGYCWYTCCAACCPSWTSCSTET